MPFECSIRIYVSLCFSWKSAFIYQFAYLFISRIVTLIIDVFLLYVISEDLKWEMGEEQWPFCVYTWCCDVLLIFLMYFMMYFAMAIISLGHQFSILLLLLMIWTCFTSFESLYKLYWIWSLDRLRPSLWLIIDNL